jgi:hypothetical protein
MRKFIYFGSLLMVSFLFLGCDLFNAELDKNVLDKIDTKVREANAPVLKVRVYEDDMGTASPRGTLTGIKQGIPFILNYMAKTEYPFTGWQAMIEGSGGIVASWTPETADNPDKITWEPLNIPGTETRITIHFNPGADQTIVIGPYGMSWPYLTVEVAEGDMGNAQPRGPLRGIKQGIPFTLDYTANAEYPFRGWQAMVDGSEDIVAAWFCQRRRGQGRYQAAG